MMGEYNETGRGEDRQVAAQMALVQRMHDLSENQRKIVQAAAREMQSYFNGEGSATFSVLPGMYHQDLEVVGAVLSGVVVLDADMMCTLIGQEGWVDPDLTGDVIRLSDGVTVEITAGGPHGRGADIGSVMGGWAATGAEVELRGYMTPPIYVVTNIMTCESVLIIRTLGEEDD